MFEKLISKSSNHPRQLLQLDAFGAFLTILLTLFIIIPLESVLGIPIHALQILVVLPCLYLIFDLYSLLKAKSTMRQALKIIAFANIFYCIASLAFALFHYESVRFIGWLYIAIEILLIVSLAVIELKVSKKLQDFKKL